MCTHVHCYAHLSTVEVERWLTFWSGLYSAGVYSNPLVPCITYAFDALTAFSHLQVLAYLLSPDQSDSAAVFVGKLVRAVISKV